MFRPKNLNVRHLWRFLSFQLYWAQMMKFGAQRVTNFRANTVCKLLRFLLVIPATNVASERSFSDVHRIKSFLCFTMMQQRMNHFMVLHIHRKLTDKLDLVKTGYTFISGNDHRHQARMQAAMSQMMWMTVQMQMKKWQMQQSTVHRP